MTKNKTIEELNLMDDFLFQEVLSDAKDGKEAARLMLGIIMGKKIGDISVKTQHVMTTGNPDKHAIRMDVYLEEDEEAKPKTVYDLEVQKADTKELPQRTRYYQALVDTRLLKKGMDYKDLKNLVIIVISGEDIFGYDRMYYTFENRCVEVPELALEDGARKIFLYSKGKVDAREDLAELLQYIEDSRERNAVSDVMKRLHQIVGRVKNNEEVGVRYMKAIEYEDMIREKAEAEGRAKGEAEGRAEGRAEGEYKKLISLICKKLQKGKSVVEMAEALEEEVEYIADIYNIVIRHAPDYDVDKIYEEWKNGREKL